ncbi:aryldialkylphosphatase [soil metagenome]
MRTKKGNVVGVLLLVSLLVSDWACAPRRPEQAREGVLAPEEAPAIIMTVQGPLPPNELGPTLPHEHVLVDFIGAEEVDPRRYNQEEAFTVALPHLRRARELGVRTIIECTPDYLGRDPVLLRRLSEASGLHLLTNTGYYGAVEGKYLPQHAHIETADQLAARWDLEWREGIAGTGIRPGFIKISVNKSPLVAVDRKLVQAAGRTHRKNGLTIASHTGSGAAALEELAILQEEGVAGQAFIWVHAQSEKDRSFHLQAARQGAWLSFDGLSPSNLPEYLAHLQALKEANLLGQVLLSHDAGWYSVGEPGGGDFRSYETLFQDFIPLLQETGFTGAEIRQLTVENPQRAFTVRVRGVIKN